MRYPLDANRLYAKLVARDPAAVEYGATYIDWFGGCGPRDGLLYRVLGPVVRQAQNLPPVVPRFHDFRSRAHRAHWMVSSGARPVFAEFVSNAGA